jgi:hypothetical protein
VHRRLRQTGPALLVPLAWMFTAVAHRGRLAERTVLVGLVVMCSLLIMFATLSWSEMTEGVLRAWRTVIVAGTGLTAVGVAALAGVADGLSLPWLVVVGWMVLPTAGLAYTARHADAGRGVSAWAAGCSALGTTVFVGGTVSAGGVGEMLGIGLVGLGQTAGIVDAVWRY